MPLVYIAKTLNERDEKQFELCDALALDLSLFFLEKESEHNRSVTPGEPLSVRCCRKVQTAPRSPPTFVLLPERRGTSERSVLESHHRNKQEWVMIDVHVCLRQLLAFPETRRHCILYR